MKFLMGLLRSRMQTRFSKVYLSNGYFSFHLLPNKKIKVKLLSYVSICIDHIEYTLVFRRQGSLSLPCANRKPSEYCCYATCLRTYWPNFHRYRMALKSWNWFYSPTSLSNHFLSSFSLGFCSWTYFQIPFAYFFSTHSFSKASDLSSAASKLSKESYSLLTITIWDLCCWYYSVHTSFSCRWLTSSGSLCRIWTASSTSGSCKWHVYHSDSTHCKAIPLFSLSSSSYIHEAN